jgi:acyl carrier protein
MGEGDYCAANTVLDAFADAMDDPAGTRVCSVLWGPWQHDSWQATALAHSPGLARAVREYRERSGIRESAGVAHAGRVLVNGRPNVMVLGEPLPDLMRQWVTLNQGDAAVTAGGTQTAAMRRYPRPTLRQAYVEPRDELERQIAGIWGAFLGIENVGIHDPFFELGGNSLVGMSIVRALERELSTTVPPAALFEHPTVAGLAARLGSAPAEGNGADGTAPANASAARGRLRRQSRTSSISTRKRGRAK